MGSRPIVASVKSPWYIPPLIAPDFPRYESQSQQLRVWKMIVETAKLFVDSFGYGHERLTVIEKESKD